MSEMCRLRFLVLAWLLTMTTATLTFDKVQQWSPEEIVKSEDWFEMKKDASRALSHPWMVAFAEFHKFVIPCNRRLFVII